MSCCQTATYAVYPGISQTADLDSFMANLLYVEDTNLKVCVTLKLQVSAVWWTPWNPKAQTATFQLQICDKFPLFTLFTCHYWHKYVLWGQTYVSNYFESSIFTWILDHWHFTNFLRAKLDTLKLQTLAVLWTVFIC